MSFVKEETPTNTPTDLISRQDAINAIENTDVKITAGEWDELTNAIKSLQSAEPKTGEWIWSDEDASWMCGACCCVFEEIDWKPNYNYCPNCGVRMKGGEDE